MGFLLLLAVFIGYSCFINDKLKINSAFIPIMVITSITCVNFLFGIVNKLKLSINIINVIGILLLIYYIIQTIKKSYSIKFLLCPAIIFFILTSAYFIFLLKDLSYFHYDNFSHFGKIVKEMFYFDSLPNKNTTITFQNYPPATALFIYFFDKVIVYSEGYALAGQAVLIMCTLTAFLWKSDWKNMVFNFFSIIVIFVTLSILTFDDTTLHIYNLLVDGILGFLTSAAIIISYYYRNDIKKNLCINLPLLSFLVLTKESGKLFFFIVVLFILISNSQIKIHKDNINKLKYVLPLVLILILVPLLFSSLWKNYVMRAYPVEAYGANKFVVTQSKLTENFNSHSKEFIRTLHIKMIDKLLDIHSINTQLFIAANIISILVSVMYYIFEKKRAKLQLKALALSDCMMFVYIIGEYLMYLLIMPDREAVNLASFDRYISSAIIICVSMQLMCAVNTINEIVQNINCREKVNFSNNQLYRRKYVSVKLFLLILCFILMLPNCYLVRFGMKQLVVRPNEDNFRRGNFTKVSQIVKSYLGRDQSVLVYNGDKDNGTGFYLYLGKYELLTEELQVIDRKMIDTDNNKVQSLIAKRDYIVMAENDETFWSELEKEHVVCMDEKDGVLYKIIHEGEKIEIEKIA
jgi:hypothetical protein